MASVRCKSCGYENLPEARFCANCGSSLETSVMQPEPVAISGMETATTEAAVAYAGFWIRLGAAIIDSIITSVVSSIFSFTGGISMVSPIFAILVPWLYYWLFTGLRGQTPGKMAFGIKVVNAEGSVPGLSMAALREIPGKILSTIIIFVGFLWIIWDGRKQGWHDKIAGTYVVRVESRR